MPQKIFEDLLNLINQFGNAAPEFTNQYAELTNSLTLEAEYYASGKKPARSLRKKTWSI